MALRISLDKFLAPTNADKVRISQFDSEASPKSTLVTYCNGARTSLSLDALLASCDVNDIKHGECDSEASTMPSTPEVKSAEQPSRTLSPSALRISLDESLSPFKSEEIEASERQDPTLEGKTKVMVHDNILMNGQYPTRSRTKRKPFIDGVPSRGSKNHCIGKCRPCKHVQTGRKCAHGVLCNFCHMPHREIENHVTFGRAFLTSEARNVENDLQCEPCPSILSDTLPWYIQLPQMHLEL
jgi:hypothetical protein